MSQGPLATEGETRLELKKPGHERGRRWKLPPFQGPKGEAQGRECGGLGGKTGSQSSPQPEEGGSRVWAEHLDDTVWETASPEQDVRGTQERGGRPSNWLHVQRHGPSTRILLLS